MVVWLMVALILASIVFSVKTMGEYRVIVQDLQPRIEILISRADKFEEQALDETDRRQAKERVRELREICADVKRNTRDVETILRRAKQEEEQLELEGPKSRFRGSPTRLVR